MGEIFVNQSIRWKLLVKTRVKELTTNIFKQYKPLIGVTAYCYKDMIIKEFNNSNYLQDICEANPNKIIYILYKQTDRAIFEVHID